MLFRSCSADADQLERRAERREQLRPLVRPQRGELEHDREVVRQLGALEREAGLRVAALEPDELEAALPPVAVGVVREVEAAAPVEVERLDVRAAQLGERRRGEPRRAPPRRRRARRAGAPAAASRSSGSASSSSSSGYTSSRASSFAFTSSSGSRGRRRSSRRPAPAPRAARRRRGPSSSAARRSSPGLPRSRGRTRPGANAD